MNSIQKKVIGVLVLIVSIAFSCSSLKKTKEFGFFNGAEYFNDSLKIYGRFFGDIKFEKKKFKRITLKPYKKKNLLLYGKSSEEYELFLYYLEKKGEIETKLLKNNIKKKEVVYQKSDGKRVLTLVLRSFYKEESLNKTILIDGKNIIESFKFNTINNNELTYMKLFNNYKNKGNYLFMLNKFKKAPIIENKQNKWTKFQLLTTFLSNVPKYKEYNNLIDKYETKRKTYLKSDLNKILINDSVAKYFNNESIEQIVNLARDKKVLMLNEMHWKPQHRILATQLLKPLKKNGYKYLMIEAIDKDYCKTLNQRGYPTFNTGYYTREPHFGLFLRRALDLGYKIIAYDDFETVNREVSQAENIKKVLDVSETSSKIFVYGGIDHILERNPLKKKRMAEYFKELTGIDPLTIDQVELVGDLPYDFSLFESSLFKEVKKVNSNVDFFLLNNKKITLDYYSEKIQSVDYKDSIFNKYIGQEIFLSVYFFKEYEIHKTSSIPLLNEILTLKTNKINIHLPLGKYYLSVKDIDNNKLILKEIEVK